MHSNAKHVVTHGREDVLSGSRPLSPLDEGSPTGSAPHEQQLECSCAQLAGGPNCLSPGS